MRNYFSSRSYDPNWTEFASFLAPHGATNICGLLTKFGGLNCLLLKCRLLGSKPLLWEWQEPILLTCRAHNFLNMYVRTGERQQLQHRLVFSAVCRRPARACGWTSPHQNFTDAPITKIGPKIARELPDPGLIVGGHRKESGDARQQEQVTAVPAKRDDAKQVL